MPTSTVGAGDALADRLGRGFGALGVARREHDARAGSGERTRGLDADPGRRAGDDRDRAAQVDAVDHVVGGGLEAVASWARAPVVRR